MTNPIMDMLNQRGTQAQNSQELSTQDKIKKTNDLVNSHQGNAMAAAMDLCRQKGIDPQQFMSNPQAAIIAFCKQAGYNPQTLLTQFLGK